MAEAYPSVKELRGQGQADLQSHLEKLRAELWQHRVKVREGALQQTHLLSQVRRQIARVQTVLRAQQR